MDLSYDLVAASRSERAIAEIRTYGIKAGRREEFPRYFETHVAPLQRSKGIVIVGPFRDIEDGDTIVWLRTFPSLDDCKRMLGAFYESDEWKDGLKEITGDMVEGQSQVLVLLPGWMLSDPASAER